MQEKSKKSSILSHAATALCSIILTITIIYILFNLGTIPYFHRLSDEQVAEIIAKSRRPENKHESYKKYKDQMHPSGMMVVELPVLNRNIEDKESLSSWDYAYDCFVDLVIKDALMLPHVRVIGFSADKADPNITNVTFSLTMGQEESLESARQKLEEIIVYIKKGNKEIEPSVLDRTPRIS